jgi:hypothetical protein
MQLVWCAVAAPGSHWTTPVAVLGVFSGEALAANTRKPDG